MRKILKYWWLLLLPISVQVSVVWVLPTPMWQKPAAYICIGLDAIIAVLCYWTQRRDKLNQRLHEMRQRIGVED